MWGYGTPESVDDCVERGRILVCYALLSSPATADTNYTLTSPDDRVKFVGGNAQNQLPITITANTSLATFSVFGDIKSQEVGDAVIHAHQGSIYTTPEARLNLTVFAIKESGISATANGTYALSADRSRYAPVAGTTGVDMKARITIEPSGLSAAAPQILRVGMLQNLTSADYRIYYNRPSMLLWHPGIQSGETVRIPASYYRSFSSPEQNGTPIALNDSEASVSPLYDQPGRPNTLDQRSLQAPFGTPQGALAETYDSPEIRDIAAALNVEVLSSDGRIAGIATYNFDRVSIEADFLLWSVWYSPTNSQYIRTRETDWAINVRSSATTPQKATSSYGSRAVTSPQAPIEPFAAPTVNANTQFLRNGVDTRTFQRP